MHYVRMGRECYLARMNMARMKKDGTACNMFGFQVSMTAHRDSEPHNSGHVWPVGLAIITMRYAHFCD